MTAAHVDEALVRAAAIARVRRAVRPSPIVVRCRVRELLAREGLTMRRFSRLSGIPYETVRKLLHPARRRWNGTRLDVAFRVSLALGLPIHELFTFEAVDRSRTS